MSASAPNQPRLEDIRTELAKRRLWAFVKYGWHVLEPGTDLVWNWHIEAICMHLEALVPLERRGDRRGVLKMIRRLLMNVPPGHMKSLLLCVFFPAWIWTFWPEFRGLFGSLSMELAIRDSIRCRDLIVSDWYQDWFKPDWALKTDQNLKQHFANTKGGVRQCVAVGSSVTGFRGDGVFWDDILNAKEAHSQAAREDAIRFLKAFSTRLNDPRTGMRAGIMQRLHEEDPSGYLLKQGGWDHLCLASEFDPERKSTTSIDFEDPRSEHGELLFPERFTPEVIALTKVELGSDGFAGQHQQRPSPAGGLILKRHWFRYWVPRGVKLPPVTVELEDGSLYTAIVEELPAESEFDESCQSWDMAFKDTATSDFVSGGLYSRKGASVYLRDQIRDRLSFSKSVDAVRDMSRRWPNATAKYVEDKANGPAIIDTLKAEIPGLIAIDPAGGKIARTYAVQPYIEAGNYYLPHPALFAWVEPTIVEYIAFNKGAHDDRVDEMTQALRRLLVKHLPTSGAATHVPPISYAAWNYRPR